MTDRDRLIELITEKQLWGIDQIQPNGFNIELFENEDLADHLLANGVFLLPEDLRGTEDFSVSAFIEALQMYKEKDRYIKLPCKVGDIVYYIFEGEIRELTVISLSYMFSENIKHFNLHTTNYRGAVLSYEIKDIGKTVFLTKVEAEAELRKRGEQNAQ